ncbi:MAG TPA: MSEP-CTERM sorting domain-containing protein [Chthoniobacteraceae bacterium]|nr:MSEP-CTERM sorting domain-containing protein [Chthoniobacteraceae bacterium]
MNTDDLDQALRGTLGGPAPAEVHADTQRHFDALAAALRRPGGAPEAARRPLLPDFFKQPFILLWVAIVPQIILLLICLRGYNLMAADLTPAQNTMWFAMMGWLLVMLLGEGVAMFFLRIQKQRVPLAMALALIALPVCYLWFVMFQTENIIPQTFAIWVLPPGELIFYQFAFIMPVIIYGTLRLACMDLRIRRSQEISLTASSIVAPPLIFLGLAVVGGPFWGYKDAWMLLIPVGIACTVVMFAGITRICVILFNRMQRSRPGVKSALMFLICVAAPLGGLLLNSSIPFPVDFQAWHVYALAAVNGVLLMLPRFRQPLARRTVWFAQCALFPFTLYFFVVFMPYLPFSIPAMILIGLGSLILVPSVLFLIHGQQLIAGYREEAVSGHRRMAMAMAVLALLILPGIFTAETVNDRMVLNSALDYVYNPDYSAPADRFAGDPAAVERSLDHLRDYKAGVYMPFLSDFYDWYVFGKLVLPDEKMNAMHTAFFGRELAASRGDRMDWYGGRRNPRESFSEIPQGLERGPSGKTTAECVTLQSRAADGCEFRTVSLDVTNHGDFNDEYVTAIHLPEGTMISSFRLKVGNETVPGRICEKKTALWVYQTIRDYQDWPDPGLLVYTDPGSVQLRISPVAPGETRHAEIEFVYPAGLNPDIRIGDKPLEKETATSSLIVTRTADGTASAIITPAMLSQLPVAPRVPYLHFIVDRSAHSGMSDEQVLDAIHSASAKFSGAKECSITFANYESVTAGGGNTPLLALDRIDASALNDVKRLPARGGFLPARAMKRALLEYGRELSTNDAMRGKYPVFILITDSTEKPAGLDQFEAFARLAPDTNYFFTTADGGALQPWSFTGDRVSFIPGKANLLVVPENPDWFDPKPVALLKMGDAVAACPVNPDGDPREISFDSPNAAAIIAGSSGPVVMHDVLSIPPRIAVLDHGAFRDLAPTATIGPATPYARGVRAWQQYLEWVYNPSLGNQGLANVVRISRESGILTAATSMIVVENDAQWKLLDIKQTQKLNNKTALEFTNTPEPSTWALIGIGGVALVYAVRRKRKAAAK